MSRVGNKPIEVPSGVEVKTDGHRITAKGPKGELQWALPSNVALETGDGVIQVKAAQETPRIRSLAGTSRAVINNMVIGVSTGYERKLEINGIGYRAQVKGNTLNLSLGFSHPVDFDVPDGITIETPSQTEILIKGIDKQKVGQVAANIRKFRPPEPYKGKGVRYANEHVRRKEAKKG